MDHRKRLAHAHDQLKGLKRAVGVFLKRDPYVVGVIDDQKEHCYIARLRVVRPMPETWALRVGDIAHNLRSALDNLTYALALAHSKTLTEKQVKRLQFPICENPGEFFGSKKKPGQLDRIAPLHPYARTLIETLQPYNRRVKGSRHPLSVLNDLANINKHRHILVLLQSSTSARIDISGPGIPAGLTIKCYIGPFEDGTVLAKWSFNPGSSARRVHPKVNVTPHLGFDVAFDKGPPAHGGSVQGFLNNLHDVIRDTIFVPLEAFL